MENHGLLRTAKFGGFEKSDVLNYIDRIDSEKRELELKLKEALENVNPVFDDGESKKLKIEVAELNNKLAAKDSDIKSLEQSAAEQKEFYESQIAKLNEMLENAGSGGVETDALIEQIKMRDESIAEKDETIARLENEISSLKSDSEVKDSKIADLNSEINRKDSEIEELKLNQGGGQSALDMGTMFAEAQKTVNKLTLEAKNNADKITKEAEEKAAETISSAEEKASKTISEADEKAEKTISDAEEKAEKTIADAEEKAAKTISDAEKLTAQKSADIERQSKTLADLTSNIKNLLTKKLNAVSESLAETEKSVAEAVKAVSEASENISSDTAIEDILGQIPSGEAPVSAVSAPVSDEEDDEPAPASKVFGLEDLTADDTSETAPADNGKKIYGLDDLETSDVPKMPKKKVFDLSDLEDL